MPVGPLVTRREFERLTQFITRPRCLIVCAIAVQGSRGTPARFREDLARAEEVFACANLRFVEGGYLPVNDNTLRDLTGWTITITDGVPMITTDADARRLLAMGPACGRQQPPGLRPNVFVYYVRTLGDGYNGLGATNFANDAPGLVVSDASGDYTVAHEFGHILGLPHVPNMQTDNIMYFDSPNITAVPPVITQEQCNLARRSTVPQACPDPLAMVPPRQRPPIRVRPPIDLPPSLQGLLSDDPGVVERFAARGQAILPDLLSRVNDPSLAVRVRVLAVLARIGGPMALQAVERALLADPSPSARSTAAAGLARIGVPMAATMLNRSLQDADPGVRSAVVRSLAQLPLPATRRLLDQVVMTERDPLVRSLAGRLGAGLVR